MYKELLRPAWAEINLMNLAHNIREIRKSVGGNCEIIGVVKADGYGHGAYECAKVLKQEGVKAFGVATLHEAIALRKRGIDDEIVMLGIVPALYADTIVEYNLTPIVCSFENAEAISKEAKKSKKTVEGYIGIDTGMNRVGMLCRAPETLEEIKKINLLENFKIKGIASHFATSDEADKTYAKEQEARYTSFCSRLMKEGIQIPKRSIANSGAVMELPSAHFEAVRPGIILYGCYPSDEVRRDEILLKPVMSVKANIVCLKKISAGETVSYGRRFTAMRESLIATIGIGYADGYPRPYSANGKVIVNGVIAPIAGNICMDQCMVDVTDVPGVKLGDEIIIMGSDGKQEILADDIATATGTVNYEIVCAFGQRLPKKYMR